MKRVITITSGKGGVGKTNISVNLAAQLAKAGLRTCIFDADLGLANINILLGLRPEYNLEDVIAGEKSLADILVHDPCGVDIIPGGTGVEKLAAMAPEDLSGIIESFSCLEGYDVLFFDTSAGISREVLSFCMAAKEVALVLIPEPTSLTDGYSLLKVLSLNGYRDRVHVVINQAKSDRFAQAVFNKFRDTVRKYLPLDISYAGCLPADDTVAEAVARQRPFVALYPSARASGAIARLARHLLASPGPEFSDGVFDGFWEKYIEFAKVPIKLPQKKAEQKAAQAPSSRLPEEKQEADSLNASSPSEEKQHTPSPPQVEAGSDDTALPQQILNSLNRLIDAATDISTELKAFRRDFEKQTHAAPAAPENTTSSQQAPPIIALDFEAYVERKNRPKS